MQMTRATTEVVRFTNWARVLALDRRPAHLPSSDGSGPRGRSHPCSCTQPKGIAIMSGKATTVAPYGDDLPERRKPFVPNPDRIVYPVDHVTTQRAAFEKFQAETRIVVGGQLTRRIVAEACDLEDEIRARVHDNAQYAGLAVVLSTFLADSIEVRHQYMHPEDDQRRFR
jgi:hypothetical protein